MKPEVKAFFDEATFTVSYVVKDPESDSAAVIDSVLDYEPRSGRTDTRSADAIIAYVKENDLKIEWMLETHAHADHLSAAPYIQKELGGTTAIGAHITDVQDVFAKLFNVEKSFQTDGRQFEHLLEDGEAFKIGGMTFRAMHTPGHTPACMTYVTDGVAFVGDTLFMPDYGTARADFPGGDARTLYQSIQKVLALPDETVLYMCHDYKAPGRDEFAWENHGRRAESHQCPCRRRCDRRRIRGHARGARRDTRHADPHPALCAGEHSGWRDATRRRERCHVPEDSDQPTLIMNVGAARRAAPRKETCMTFPMRDQARSIRLSEPPHAAEALVLNCMDYRLIGAVADYLDARGLRGHYDQISLAGGAIGVMSDQAAPWAETFWAHVKLARTLHGISKVIVIDRRDCGACKAFVGADCADDPEPEMVIHMQKMEALADEIRTREPGLQVELFLKDLDGTVVPLDA